MAQDSSKADFWETRYDSNVTPWDAGRSPGSIISFVKTLPPGLRVLVPGCGSGYEVALFADAGMDVVAIDFSEGAIRRARATVPNHAGRFLLADFFAFDAGDGFDLMYERAFLCALPRSLWPGYAARTASILRPGGRIAGFWFFDDNEKGPPFGISLAALDGLLGPAFARTEDRPETESIPVFQGKERWQVWQKR